MEPWVSSFTICKRRQTSRHVAQNTANAGDQGAAATHRVRLDHLGTVGKLQRGQRLTEAVLNGGDGRHNECFGIPANGVLQQERQLGIAVVHVPVLAVGDVHQCIDHVSQRRQRPVNVAGLRTRHHQGHG